jgi:tetratricopeptide (TPR) repeat protein
MITPGKVPVGYHRELLDLLAELRGRSQSPSLRAIGRSAAVSVGHLSGVFAGKAVPSPDVAVAIARALKATVAEQHRVRGYAERAAVDKSATRTGGGGRVVPRQLPAAVAHFAGRTGELATLSGLLRRRAGVAGTVVISAIGGTAGVGKTALAVHWAHRVAVRFPDGQLYVDLRGFSPGGQVVAPGEAVRRFLDAFQVPPERIPVDLDAQAALYRSLLAGRRMLVVLDNAYDSAQVRPLLPGAPTCLVVVTSRNRLTGLVAAAGAHLLDLDLLPAAEAGELLVQRLGTERVAAEPDAVEEIIARCARLPLALALVAAQAAARPRVALQVLAGELRDAQQRWQTLTSDDPATDVRAVFSWSYQALTPNAARLFRLLGLHPGPDIATPAAASLAGAPTDEIRPLLKDLAAANLIVEHLPGRYAFHDLLRAYATELAHTHDTDSQLHAAIHRMLDHYLHTAHTGALLLNPFRDPISPTPPQPGITPEHLADHGQALAWFSTEHAVLLAALDLAADAGLDTHTWQLAWTLANYLNRQGHWHDQIATGHAALAASGRLADPSAQALAHRSLAAACATLGRFDDAHTHLQQALDLYRRSGEQTKQAPTHLNLAVVLERQGRYTDALYHARQALDLSRAAGHQAGQADALNAVGWYCALLGDHQQALTSCQQALGLHQRLNDRQGQAATWDSLGYAHHNLGHHTQAATCYQHALDLYRDLGYRQGEADTLIRLGDTHHATSNPQAACDAWQQALTILNDLDHPDAAQVRTKLTDLDPPTDKATG